METTMLIGERFFADKFSYAFLTKPQVEMLLHLMILDLSIFKKSDKTMVQYYCPMPFGVVLVL